MIDTLQLYCQDFKIQKNASLTIQPYPFSLETGKPKETEYILLSNENFLNEETGEINGDKVIGQKAFYNDDKLNLTIQNPTTMFCHFSIPKVYHFGNNFLPTSKEETERVLKFVENHLSQKVGVKLNIDKTSISRLDLFKTATLSLPLPFYGKVFELLNGKRKMDKRNYGGETFLWFNTRQEFCVYDKIAEMEAREMVFDRASIPENSIRFEWRLKSKRKVFETFGFHSTHSLLQEYDSLQEGYKKAWKETIFTYTPKEDDTMKDTGSILTLEVMKYFKKKYQRGWKMRMSLAFLIIEQEAKQPLEAFKKAYIEVEETKQMRYLAKKTFEEAMIDIKMVRKLNEKHPQTGNELYKEMTEKVVG